MTTRPWQASVLTLYPEMFPGPLGVSLAGRALQQEIWRLETIHIRDFAHDRHRSIDDTPAGGGPGMVMRADVICAAIDHAAQSRPGLPLIYLSARGEPLTQQRVRALSEGAGAILLCGRFEGVDERVIERREVEEVSIGDFVLSGGEIAAMALLDAVVRLLPGVMGAQASAMEESFEAGLLEYPHYTRPAEFEGLTIPDILTSGDHGKVAKWRREQAEKITRERRPDLWEKYNTKNNQSSPPGSTRQSMRRGGEDPK